MNWTQVRQREGRWYHWMNGGACCNCLPCRPPYWAPSLPHAQNQEPTALPQHNTMAGRRAHLTSSTALTARWDSRTSTHTQR